MKRTWPLLTAFSVAYAFFITAPAIFHQEFPLRTDMEWGDVLDIPTPLVVFGLVWLLVRRTVGTVDTLVAFPLLLLALVWTQGQGMHLASNSIGHQVAEGARGTLPDLIHFYDEQLSHYIWYLAVALLPGYLLLVMWRDRGLASPERPFAVLPAALLFGLVLGISPLEADGALAPQGGWGPVPALPGHAQHVRQLLLRERQVQENAVRARHAVARRQLQQLLGEAAADVQ